MLVKYQQTSYIEIVYELQDFFPDQKYLSFKTRFQQGIAGQLRGNLDKPRPTVSGSSHKRGLYKLQPCSTAKSIVVRLVSLSWVKLASKYLDRRTKRVFTLATIESNIRTRMVLTYHARIG